MPNPSRPKGDRNEYHLRGINDYRCKARWLYGAFKAWCEDGGEAMVSQRAFGQAMTEHGFKRLNSDGTWYLGVTLKETDG
jgi:hypothetical protein